MREVCASFLPPPGFHITPTEILQWSQTTVLKSNIQALLSLLYHCLEYKQCHSSTTSTSDVRVLQQKQNSVSIKKVVPPSILAKKRHSIHSFSTNDLYPSSSRARKSQGGPNSNSSSNNNSNSFQSLSLYSMSALAENYRSQEQHSVLPPIHNPAGLGSSHSSSTSSTVFKPPIRSSVTASQAAALASFKKPPLTKGPHSQSSPAMRISVSDVPPPITSKTTRQQISASTDNLFIREKMLTEKLHRAVTSGALSIPQRYTERFNNSSGNSSEASNGSSSSSLGADVSGNCTTATNSLRNGQIVGAISDREYIDGQVQHTSHRSDDDNLQLLSHVYPLHVGSSDSSKAVTQTELEIDSSSPLKLGIELKHDEIDTRSSFTLTKQHTYASASAAGLPIIDSRKGKEVVDGETTPPLKETTVSSFNNTKSQDRSSSGSSSGSAHTVVHLTSYSDRNVHVYHEKLSSVPPSILELRRQLHSKMSERRTRQAIMDKQVLIEKQKFGQKVYLAVMQKSREPSVERSVVPVPNSKPAVKKNHQTKTFSPRKIDSNRTTDSEETRTTRLSSQQTRNKSASLTQFEFIEAQVKANEELAISSTAKKPSVEPRGHPLGAIALSPIAPCKVDESIETSNEDDEVFSSKQDAVDVKDVGHNPWGEQQQSHLKQPTLNPVSCYSFA